MKHAILLLWHTNVKQLMELIDRFDDDFTFYIHVDKKSNEVIEELKRKNNVHIYRKYKVNWGGFNILKAELFLLRKIVAGSKGKHYEYVHFFSGQDYPIKDLRYIKDFFERNKGKEFVQYMKVPSPVWENNTYNRYLYYRLYDWFDYRTRKGERKVKSILTFQKKHGFKRPIPKQFPQLYGGSNWMSITLSCAEYIISNRRRSKSFYNRLKYTFAPEETFFQTIILNSRFSAQVENWNLRHIVWDGGSSPRTLTIKDWYYLQTTKDLFARKFDFTESKDVISMINTYLLNEQNMNASLDKDVILLVSHTVNKVLIHKYHQIKKQMPEFDVILLLDDEEGRIDTKLLEGIDCRIFDVDMLNDLNYEPIEETLIPGSNHFALLWFFLHNPRYKNYWNIEYDVDFTGDWGVLFKSFQSVSADFISTHIQTYEETPNWYWWNSYHGVTLNIPLIKRIRSFNPIYRISPAALSFLDQFLKKGNSGHHEVLIPTALYHSGFNIVDFGGCGKFVLPQYTEKFYYFSSIMPNGMKGSMRDKPNISSVSSFHIPDKLFHPVKNDIMSAGLRVLTIVVTWNGIDVIDKCLSSLHKSVYPITIYVIDNHSTDGTAEFVKANYPDVVLVENAMNIGFGQANNQGFKYALNNGFDYVFLLNQDAYVEPNTIFRLLQVQNRYPEYGLLSPMHYLDANKLDDNFFHYIKAGCPEYIEQLILYKEELKDVYASGFINAAAWLLDVNCVRKAGGFSPVFFHTGEDEDYYNRVIYNGFKVGIVPAAIIYHTRSSHGKLPEYGSLCFRQCKQWELLLLNPRYDLTLAQVLKHLFEECLYCLVLGKYRKFKENLHIICKLWKKRNCLQKP